MKLVIGIGNPGEKYANTRHNVGFMVMDKLAQELGTGNFELSKKFQSLVVSHQLSVVLAKPTTFMNSSGVTVKKLVTQYKVKMSDLWVIHDDLDLRLGEYKIQFGVGPKLHYGVQSIEEELGRKDFWRVRVGVDNRSSDNRIPGETYVLQNFDETEIETRDRIIEEVVKELTARLVATV